MNVFTFALIVVVAVAADQDRLRNFFMTRHDLLSIWCSSECRLIADGNFTRVDFHHDTHGCFEAISKLSSDMMTEIPDVNATELLLDRTFCDNFFPFVTSTPAPQEITPVPIIFIAIFVVLFLLTIGFVSIVACGSKK